ncbi:hypothetical protein JOC27_001766 [Sporolactobacillus spathodeae]|uniref:Uncharacterized protein n=1 Tax=Sporolactobacillus spathodeae TaxID=1465502 RepID=A0ABS2Q940_9BACL|nr:hypothetical protein [Sporolactobacillus spathodeae]
MRGLTWLAVPAGVSHLRFIFTKKSYALLFRKTGDRLICIKLLRSLACRGRSVSLLKQAIICGVSLGSLFPQASRTCALFLQKSLMPYFLEKQAIALFALNCFGRSLAAGDP